MKQIEMYIIKQIMYRKHLYAMITIECFDETELKKFATNIQPIIQEMGYIVETEFKDD